VEPVWRQTEQFKKVEYVRVEVRSARSLTRRSEWPEEYRWVLDLFLESDASEGVRSLYTPRFVIASRAENRILLTSSGNEGWSRTIKPWLDRHVGA
jgi:hypothetical protein